MSARPSRDADVIVIGAGVAGVEAAARLLRARQRVIVLEARPRIGGRIDTQRLAGWPAPVEAGAEFVHGRPPNLIDAFHSAHARLGGHPQRHERARRGDAAGAERAWADVQSVIEDLPDEDVAVMDVLRRPEFARRLSPAARALMIGFSSHTGSSALNSSSAWTILTFIAGHARPKRDGIYVEFL